MAENSPNLAKDTNLQIKKAELSKCIKTEFQKTKIKKKIEGSEKEMTLYL